MKLSRTLITFALTARSLSSQVALDQTQLQTFNKNNLICKGNQAHYEPTVTKVTIENRLSEIDNQAVFIVANGGHNSQDINYLFMYMAEELRRQNKHPRYYLEFMGDHPGLVELTKNLAKTFRTGNPITDVNSLILSLNFMANLNDGGSAHVFGADNGEGSPFYDSGLQYLSNDTILKFNQFLN